jgi:hypothetical protein
MYTVRCAQSKGTSGHPLREIRSTARPRKGTEGSLLGSPCSRNPHDETVVVRRAQVGTKPGLPLNRSSSLLGMTKKKDMREVL